MRPRLLLFVACIGLLLPPQPVLACLWDYDTLRDEQRGLPTMSAILAGKWERHSDWFYEQRVGQMRELLAREPANLAAIDNLAVALEKLGKVDEAIALMEQKLALPDGGPHPHYTTHANLGTFYLHRYGASRDVADLDRVIEHIRGALQINENAHFGREEYQLQVAEYIREGLDDPTKLEMGSFVLPLVVRGRDYTQLLQDFRNTKDAKERADALRYTMPYSTRSAPEDLKAQLQPPIDGIVGMIRFGTGTSPLLYHALGDLLAARGDKHLAVRAYLRALEYDHPRPEQVEQAVDQVFESLRGATRSEIASQFAREKQDAADWVAAYQAFEDDLVRRGADLSDESVYEPFYREHGQPRAELGFALSDHLPREPAARATLVAAVVFGGLLLLIVFALVRWRVQRRRRRQGAAFA